jgi:hypothetical protein
LHRESDRERERDCGSERNPACRCAVPERDPKRESDPAPVLTLLRRNANISITQADIISIEEQPSKQPQRSVPATQPSQQQPPHPLPPHPKTNHHQTDVNLKPRTAMIKHTSTTNNDDSLKAAILQANPTLVQYNGERENTSPSNS